MEISLVTNVLDSISEPGGYPGGDPCQAERTEDNGSGMCLKHPSLSILNIWRMDSVHYISRCLHYMFYLKIFCNVFAQLEMNNDYNDLYNDLFGTFEKFNKTTRNIKNK